MIMSCRVFNSYFRMKLILILCVLFYYISLLEFYNHPLSFPKMHVHVKKQLLLTSTICDCCVSTKIWMLGFIFLNITYWLIFFPYKTVRYVYFAHNLSCLCKQPVFQYTSLAPTIYLTYCCLFIDSLESIIIHLVILNDFQFFPVNITMKGLLINTTYRCITALYFSFVMQISTTPINFITIQISCLSYRPFGYPF